MINDVNGDDIALESHGVKIFIDAKWSHLLQQIKVDYLEEKIWIKTKTFNFY